MDRTDAFAFVYKARRGWTYDTDDAGALRHGPFFPTWREAFDAAHRAAFILRFRPIQERIDETAKRLSRLGYRAPVLVTTGLPSEPTCHHCGLTVLMHNSNDCMGDWSTSPPALVWEGDYA